MNRHLATTLADLAAFGEKRAGSEAGARAAAYLYERMRHLGLDDVHTEPFAFPRHEIAQASFALTVAGREHVARWEVLEGSGSGTVAAELVHVGWATREQLAEVALAGRIALVDRNPLYHRSTQYYNCEGAGAAAMIFASAAPANLPQVGSIRRAWEAIGPIPALTIGAADAHAVRQALQASAPVSAHIAVAASVSRGIGRNVVGRVRGLGAGELVVGAHFDTWFAGSSDNGGGVAAMLALAERRVRQPPARYGISFVAWDGEELALYGGYQLLRRYALDGTRPLCVIDFETPSALGAQAYGLARSNHAPRRRRHRRGRARRAVRAQRADGSRRRAVRRRHPDRHPGALSQRRAVAGDGRRRALLSHRRGHAGQGRSGATRGDRARLRSRARPPDDGARRALRRARSCALARRGSRQPRRRPAHGCRCGYATAPARRKRDATVEAVLFADDFFAQATARGLTNEDGVVELRLPGGAALDGEGRRFLHVSAGPRWPLVELVRPL